MAKPKGSPTRTPFLREMLEKYVFLSEEKFAKWVDDNFTDAVKELGKLQPKNVTLGGDQDAPLVMKIERVIVEPTDTDS